MQNKKTIKSLSILLMFFYSVSCISLRKNTNTIIENRELLKQYALCKCLIYSFPNDSLIRSDLSMSIYRDISNYSFIVYDEIDSITKQKVINFPPPIINDYLGKKLSLMLCINGYYKSYYLDSLVKKYDTFINTPNR